MFVCFIYACILLVNATTCSLVTEIVSFMAVSSLIISIIMLSSFKPLMNSSFNHLSISLHLHSTAIICNLPIHSSTVSFSNLLNLQYCNH